MARWATTSRWRKFPSSEQINTRHRAESAQGGVVCTGRTMGSQVRPNKRSLVTEETARMIWGKQDKEQMKGEEPATGDKSSVACPRRADADPSSPSVPKALPLRWPPPRRYTTRASSFRIFLRVREVGGLSWRSGCLTQEAEKARELWGMCVPPGPRSPPFQGVSAPFHTARIKMKQQQFLLRDLN